ncbi:MAG: PilZ domain-containing protein [bacterium]
MNSEEKRKHRRFPLEKTKVELGKEVAALQDFSRRGICVRLRDILNLGERINLKIHLHKASKPLVFKGEVKWTKRTGFGSKAGIKLLQGDNKSIESIKKLYQRFENPVWRRVPAYYLPIALSIALIILVGVLGGPKIKNITYARTVSKYATEKLKCPMCGHISYSTEYAFLDIPEEMNPKQIVICPKCHKQISYYDLEVVWQKK